MKAPTNKAAALALLLVATSLVGCGAHRYSGTGSTASSTGSSTSVPPTVTIPTPPTTTPNTNVGTPALSYEFIALGSQTYTTPAINTDSVLKVKFQVGTTQDNADATHNATNQATELSVVLAVNGREVTPTFTSSNYIYGRIGETSGVIDFSSNLTPGVPVTITVKTPKNDFYCTYLASTCGVLQNSFSNPSWTACGGTWVYGDLVNTLANQYPGCRKPVYSTHRWSGKLIVQTSSTVGI